MQGERESSEQAEQPRTSRKRKRGDRTASLSLSSANHTRKSRKVAVKYSTDKTDEDKIPEMGEGMAFPWKMKTVDLNLLQISKGNMQVMESAIMFHPAKNTHRSHAYTPPFTIRLARDECLCPVRTVKAYLKATMSRPNRLKNFFVTRKQGNAITVTNSTIATWLTETLKLASIKASGGLTRKASASWAASKGISIKTILEAGD